MEPIVYFLTPAITLFIWTRAFPTVRGTTLVGLWWWTGLALAANLAAGWYGQGLMFHSTQSSHTVIGYLAAIASFCPSMALLGARRPQHRAWNVVVIVLWCALSLPAIKAALLSYDHVSVPGVYAWFLWILIIAEILNRCGTRLWTVGVLQALAQIVFLAPHLPLVKLLATDLFWEAGLLCQCVAVIVYGHYLSKQTVGSNWTSLWLSFRDSFGVLWSLRIAEQMNSSARLLNSPACLTWHGFRATDDRPWEDLVCNQEKRVALQRTYTNLLRRFLNEQAIAQAIDHPH